MFAVVDGLTRSSANLKNAADRAEADEKSGRLLAASSRGYPPANRFQEEGLNAPPAHFSDPAPAFQPANPLSRGLTGAKDRGSGPYRSARRALPTGRGDALQRPTIGGSVAFVRYRSLPDRRLRVGPWLLHSSPIQSLAVIEPVKRSSDCVDSWLRGRFASVL